MGAEHHSVTSEREGAVRTEARAGGAFAAPDAYDRFKRVRFFSCLDGLRAISIVAVIWHHTAAVAVAEHWTFFHRGNRGVMLFFVISAFLISTLLLRAKERGSLDVPRFWARRALRILPLYYAVLLLYVGVVFFLERDATARNGFFENLPAFATFTSNWFVNLDNARVIFYFAWSLAAEEQFYLCWPWIERHLSGVWPVVVAVGALIAAQAAAFVFAAGHSDVFGLKILGSIPTAILFGVMLAHGLNSRNGFKWLWRLSGRRGSAVLAAALTVTALSVEPVLGFFGEMMTAFAMTLLVAACVVREDNDLAPVLRVRAVAWVGTISYGIYLLHMLSVGVVRRALGEVDIVSPYGDFIGGVVLSIAVASISYCTFERFFLRLKDRWFAENAVSRPLPVRSPTPGTASAGAIAPADA